MSTYTILEVSETYDEWSNSFGTFHSYSVKARDPQGQERDFTMNRKAEQGSSTPPPTGEVEATEQPSKGNFPPKLKIDYSQGGGSPQSTSGGQQTTSQPATSTSMSKDDYWRRKEERDLEASRRMGRAHAQEMSLRFIEATGDAQKLNTDDDGVVSTYLNGPLKRLTDWFERDVQQAGESE